MESQNITATEFGQFQKLIYDIAGISLSDAKQMLLVGRLGKRLKHYGLTTYTEYYRLVSDKAARDELQLMVDLLTTNETYFFREEKHFDFLTETILANHPAGKTFDVWSAASSTGEEIYTIAMVLADTLGIKASWSVTGSDINQSVLDVAQRGLYQFDRTRGLHERFLKKYCMRGVGDNTGTFLIAPEVREHCRFLRVNLNTELPSLGKFNVIFLRNVMIYFDADTKRRVVERLARQLLPNGYLIIGHAETLNGITDCVRLVQPTIYRRA